MQEGNYTSNVPVGRVLYTTSRSPPRRHAPAANRIIEIAFIRLDLGPLPVAGESRRFFRHTELEPARYVHTYNDDKAV